MSLCLQENASFTIKTILRVKVCKLFCLVEVCVVLPLCFVIQISAPVLLHQSMSSPVLEKSAEDEKHLDRTHFSHLLEVC